MTLSVISAVCKPYISEKYSRC